MGTEKNVDAAMASVVRRQGDRSWHLADGEWSKRTVCGLQWSPIGWEIAPATGDRPRCPDCEAMLGKTAPAGSERLYVRQTGREVSTLAPWHVARPRMPLQRHETMCGLPWGGDGWIAGGNGQTRKEICADCMRALETDAPSPRPSEIDPPGGATAEDFRTLEAVNAFAGWPAGTRVRATCEIVYVTSDDEVPEGALGVVVAKEPRGLYGLATIEWAGKPGRGLDTFVGYLEAVPAGQEDLREAARVELLAVTETLSQAFAADLDVDRSVVESFVYGVREFLLALAPKAGG